MPALLIRLLYYAGATAFGYVANDAVEIYQGEQANKAQKLQEAVKARLKGFTERSTVIRMVIVAVALMVVGLIFMSKAQRRKLI